MISIKAEKPKTQGLCKLRVIKKGKLLTIDANVAPMPNETNKIGSAQQIIVPVLVKSANQVTPRLLSVLSVRGALLL